MGILHVENKPYLFMIGVKTEVFELQLSTDLLSNNARLIPCLGCKSLSFQNKLSIAKELQTQPSVGNMSSGLLSVRSYPRYSKAAQWTSAML